MSTAMRAAAAAIGMLAGALALGNAMADDASLAATEAAVRRSFATATPEEWASRLQQDEAQALCSRYRNRPPPDVAAKIIEGERRTFRYPADGRLLGDWRAGEKLASIGTGGHIGHIQPDPPGRPKGGNCYACHQLARGEVAAGNLGPSLTGYGSVHGTGPDAQKFVYEKIFNAQAYFACSPMPRFGRHAWLTPEQIADLVAFLLDPASPVNAAGEGTK